MTRSMLGAAALTALLAAGAVVPATGPAVAKTVSVNLRPHGESAKLVRDGLELYSLFRSAKNRGKVDQRGTANGAAIAQHGSGNFAEVFQRGRGHSGSITQTGNDNAYALFQFGRKGQSNIQQTGNGRAGITLQGSW